MRLVALLSMVVLFAGCEQSVVKDTFMTLDQLKKTRKFDGYDIEVGPIAIKGLKSCDKIENSSPSEDKEIDDANRFPIPADWKDHAELVFSGPMRVTREVNANIRMETMDKFHRRVKIADNYYYFLLDEEVTGYGFQFVSVRNKDNELALMILKTSEPVPSWDDPENRVGAGGPDPYYKTPGQRQKEADEKKAADEKAGDSDAEKGSSDSEDK